MSYPERILPDETSSGILAIHLKRYLFALPSCEGRAVLDLGCGVGYGAAKLAEVAQHVVGGDIDVESIDFARRRYGRANLEFIDLDATALTFDDASFDVVCSFETIEHVDDPGALAREAARVLRPDGTLFVSTPRSPQTTYSPANPYHRVEFSPNDFEEVLRQHFFDVILYGELRMRTRLHRLLRSLDVLGLRRRSALLRRGSVLTGTPATEYLTLDDITISREAVDRGEGLYAVCTRPRS